MEKRIRLFLILIFTMLLSGCSATYDLNINSDGTITEVISGKVTDKELNNDNRTDVNSYLYAFDIATPLIDEEGEFNKEIKDKKGYKEFTYTYNYDKNYSKSNALNKCFDDFEYYESEDEYSFYISGNFNCLLSKKVVINLTSPYKVIKHNADKVKDNKYTWIIKSSEDNLITASISKKDMYEKNDNKPLNTFRLIGLIVLIILCIIAYLLYKKNNRD